MEYVFTNNYSATRQIYPDARKTRIIWVVEDSYGIRYKEDDVIILWLVPTGGWNCSKALRLIIANWRKALRYQDHERLQRRIKGKAKQ